jgi:hypothetical protein
MAAGELLLPFDSLSDPWVDVRLARSLAVAVAGVVPIEGRGGGEVRRVGSSGGDGAKISLGGGGATTIWYS